MIIAEKSFNELKNSLCLAGERILEIYHHKDFESMIEWKPDKSPLTLADRAANDIIMAKLKEIFPKDAILSEEADDDKKRLSCERCWILDPLDGTKEFIKRNGEFTINLALAIKGEPVFGIIYAPILKTLYWAERQKGSFKQIENGAIEKINATKATAQLRFVVSRSHNHPDMDKILKEHKDKIGNIIPMGSSLKGCLIAEGSAEIYIRHTPTMEWDTAAMHIIATEAGAIFRQLDHSEMRYNREDSLNSKGFYIINRMENNFI